MGTPARSIGLQGRAQPHSSRFNSWRRPTWHEGKRLPVEGTAYVAENLRSDGPSAYVLSSTARAKAHCGELQYHPPVRRFNTAEIKGRTHHAVRTAPLYH